MKIIFFGTANISKFFLENIDKKHEIVSVVTMLDKPVGRSNKIKSPAVKEFAIEKNIPYIQVDKFNDDITEQIKKCNADVGVVVSLIVATFISFFVGYSPLSNLNFSAPKSAKENVKFTFIPADKQAPAGEELQKISEKEYTVQAGDSLEDISVRFYGKYDEAKIKEIQTRNNLKDINSIKIGQTLIIPVN